MKNSTKIDPARSLGAATPTRLLNPQIPCSCKNNTYANPQAHIGRNLKEYSNKVTLFRSQTTHTTKTYSLE